MSIRNLIPIIIIAFGCNVRNDSGMEGINILSEIKEDSEANTMENNKPITSHQSDRDLKDILTELSQVAIAEKSIDFPESILKSNWLGSETGVTDQQILEAETRLKIKLPSEYINFMKLTNGFHAPNDIEPSFFKIDEIDYYKNFDPEIAAIHNSDPYYGTEMSRSIIIGDRFGEQQFLLIPPIDSLGEWRYWKFANWIPGEQEYSDLKSYFISVLEFTHDY